MSTLVSKAQLPKKKKKKKKKINLCDITKNIFIIIMCLGPHLKPIILIRKYTESCPATEEKIKNLHRYQGFWRDNVTYCVI